MWKISIAILVMVFGLLNYGFPGCGSDDPPVVSDSPPDMNGSYICTAGCTGTCDFGSGATVTQTESAIVVFDGTHSCAGEVDNDGNVSYTCDIGSCDGVFAEGVVVSECSFLGASCQSVTYARQ